MTLIFFLVNGYLLHGNIYSETEADSIYYLRGRFSVIEGAQQYIGDDSNG